jgi:hypothetical protein
MQSIVFQVVSYPECSWFIDWWQLRVTVAEDQRMQGRLLDAGREGWETGDLPQPCNFT